MLGSHGVPRGPAALTGTGFIPSSGLVSDAARVGFNTPLVGALSACASYATLEAKRRLRVDDTLDCFAVHGVSGALGLVLTGCFATQQGQHGWISSGFSRAGARQLGVQLLGVGATAAYTPLATTLIARGFELLAGPLSYTAAEQAAGLDAACHGERAWSIGRGAKANRDDYGAATGPDATETRDDA